MCEQVGRREDGHFVRSVFDEDYATDPRYRCPHFNPYTGCECPEDFECVVRKWR